MPRRSDEHGESEQRNGLDGTQLAQPVGRRLCPTTASITLGT